ncbi:hypothetical protein DFH29DRAFT_950273 [Suillus ampliporus]|nr:hypothetical protein DFH29DRAFT_950273 [Suillus ampliporus]
MSLQPIGSSSAHERIQTNTQCRCLPCDNPRPTLISATTRFLDSLLFICAFLHTFLVLLHLVLLALSISGNGVWMTVLSASTQAFYALYCTILVYLVQHLTLYRNLIQHQKLTIVHDNCLWQQSSTTGSLWWIASITTYLGCIFVLHVASSSILQLQTWHTIGAIIPSLGQFSSSSNAGLKADGCHRKRHCRCNYFRVECGLLRNSELSYTPRLNSNQYGEVHHELVGRSVPPYQDQVVISPLASVVIPAPTISFIISTSIDHMNWEYQQAPLSGRCSCYHITFPNSILSTMFDAHIVTCNIYVERHAATVNAETNELLALSPPPAPTPPLDWEGWTAPKGDNTWDIWSPPGRSNNNYHHDKWFMYPFYTGAKHPVKICMTQSQSACYDVSLLELYFMKEIGLNVDLYQLGSRPPPPSGSKKVLCSRRQFESSLSKIFASLLWTGAKLGSDAGGFDQTTGSTVASRQVTKWHLSVEMQLAFALTASLIMLILSICMSGGIHRQKNRMPIDSVGVLQIIWLTSRLRVLKDLMSEVEDPREDALRAAGMQE